MIVSTTTTRCCALHFVIRNELSWLIKPLLAAGVDIDKTDDAGRTALMLAVFNGQVDNMIHLLAAGGDPSRRDVRDLDACDYLGISVAPDTLDSAVDHALRKLLGCLSRTPMHRPALWQLDQPGCGQDRFVFSALRDKVWSVYSLHRNGSDLRLIGGARSERPQQLRAARGSNLIAWEDADGIHVATCTGKTTRRVNADGRLLAWYPAGDRLLFAKSSGQAYQLLLRRPNIGVGETVLEGEDPDRLLWNYAWSADTGTLALIPTSFARPGTTASTEHPEAVRTISTSG